jgi:hypothetical protein
MKNELTMAMGTLGSLLLSSISMRNFKKSCGVVGTLL